MPDFYWIAVYDDGTSIQQFTSDRERKFSEIDQSSLFSFSINDENGPCMTVLPGVGTFVVKGQRFAFSDLNGGSKRRLIYYRRTRQMLRSDGTSWAEVYPTIGLQTTVDGKNHKHIATLMMDGSIKFDWW